MLSIIATPIGNLGDMSARAVEALREADAIACEDTRRTWTLLSHFNIPRPELLISYREGTEHRAGGRVLGLLEVGKRVALCSDGGYPGISDPGYRLIRAAVDAGHDLQVLPGASAITVALLSSGLSTSSYTYKGFPPRKAGALNRFFDEECDRPHTLVLFESPMRVHKSLCAALGALGDRLAAVCIELTKKHERVSRAYLSELCAEFEGKTIKGEVTIVIAGNNPKFAKSVSVPE
jgi:16S rRNA (cytidine1402-2'-O)-methyltransferase